MTEYRLASLFERGMKKAFEGAVLSDPAKSAARWAEARANLGAFLSMARGKVVYTVLPKRDLEEEVWAARLALGDEATLFAEVLDDDKARRERLSLVRLRVYKKLYTEQADRLLELMHAFVREFPDSTDRPKVEYELADLGFKLAERAWLELRKSSAQTNGVASESWAVMLRYNKLGRDVAGRLLHQKIALLEQQDYLHLCQDYLNSFYAEGDYEQLAHEAESLLGRYETGSLGWVMRRVYDGVVLAGQNPARLAEADAVFEQVLSLGFSGKSSSDQWISCAAKWRAYIALARGEWAAAQAVAKWVETAPCSKELKREFGEKYKLLTGTAN